MKRLGIALATGVLAVGLVPTTASAATTIDKSAAPNGTHVVKGAKPSCSTASGTVSCSSYELAGVGNTNATATLAATYAATVNCRNHGGQVVEVHSQDAKVSSTTGALSPVNGRMTIPSLSATQPTKADFERQATCPNPNWTAEVKGGSIALSGFTYTVKFAGYPGAYITIT